MRSAAFLALVGLSVGGCRAHTAFAPPPEPTAPVEAREHFLGQHTLGPAAREDLSMRTRLFDDRPTVRRRAGTLGGGARVTFVEDLRPLVPDPSPTASSIDETVALDERATWLLGGGGAVGGLGLATALTLLVVDLGVTPSTSARPTVELSPFFFGAAAAFVLGVAGGGALATWGVLTSDEADDARAKAFSTYDADLKKKLALP